MMKTLLVLHDSRAVKTLRLQLIHQFAVKSPQRSASKCCPFVTLHECVMRQRRVAMTSRMVRGSGAKAPAFGLLLLAAAILSAPVAHATEELSVTLDQAKLLKLPEKVATIVIGNPLIADVAVQSGGLVVVTGKGYGSTNIIVLDRAGTVLMERAIVVSGPSEQTVAV